jgi:hypothetical protein
MSLDDRLRGAYRRQLELTQRELDQRSATGPVPAGPFWKRPISTGPSPMLRLAGLAAALVVVAAGGLALINLATGDEAGVVNTEAGVSGSPATDPPAPGPDANQRSSATTEPPIAADGDSSGVGQPTGTPPSTLPRPTDSTPGQSPPETVGPSTSEPTSGTEPDVSVEPGLSAEPASGAGVAGEVCPSGRRAELEAASTRYVGENRGWGRKDDLVDEQDGPYHFMAWEPNYEQVVTVEIGLTEPVLAADVRVFQDPFTPVSGTITIEIGGRTVDIELSGTDGWRVHTFPEPVLVDGLTIERNQPEENIMEVMLCLAAE